MIETKPKGMFMNVEGAGLSGTIMPEVEIKGELIKLNESPLVLIGLLPDKNGFVELKDSKTGKTKKYFVMASTENNPKLIGILAGAKHKGKRYTPHEIAEQLSAVLELL